MAEASEQRTRRTVLRTSAAVGGLLTAGVGAAAAGPGTQPDDCVIATQDVGSWVQGCPRSGHVALVPEDTRGKVLDVCETNDMVHVDWAHASGDGWVDAAYLAEC